MIANSLKNIISQTESDQKMKLNQKQKERIFLKVNQNT